jgi:hypothetical protein
MAPHRVRLACILLRELQCMPCTRGAIVAHST